MSYGFESQATNISHLLDAAADKFGGRPFLCGEKPLTYGNARRLTNYLARHLHDRGLRRGDRVLIVSRNRDEVVLLLFAVARLGAIFSVLSHQTKAYGFRKILSQTDPKFVALAGPNLSLLSECGGRQVISFDEEIPPDAGFHFAEVSTPTGDGDAPPSQTIDLDPAALIFTSGSTGEPRGVILSHDNILFTSEAIQRRLGYVARDTVAVYLPLSFDYGLYQIFLAARAGAGLHLSSREEVGPDFVKQLAARRVSVLPAVPSIFGALCALLRRKHEALPSLRILTNTGEHLPLEHIRQLQSFLPGVRVFPMYGLTECKRVSILLPEELDGKSATVGRPLDNTYATVVGEDGRPLPPGRAGELVVRGRNVCLGYWGCAEETSATFRRDPRDGSISLWTGDLVTQDEDGYITFVARKDLLIKHKGYRVNPLEIERAAYDTGDVSEAAAAKLPDGRFVLAVSVTRPDLTSGDIILSLKERLDDHKFPDQVYVVGTLPKNRNGKLDRGALADLVRAESK